MNDKPWITKGLKHCIKKKHLLYRTYILNQTEENSLKYKTYNNKIRSILRQEENNYYKKIFNEKEIGIKQMWKYLGPILNPAKKGSKSNSIDKLVIDGVTIQNDKDIANALNNYFSNIGNELSKQVPDVSTTFKDYMPDPIEKSVYLKPTNEAELGKEIGKLKTNKSVLDIFNLNIIKSVKDQLIPGLVIVFNKSIHEGIFHDILKIAKIIPIFKKNEDYSAGNYRPISLLSIFHKLLEKIIYKRLTSFFQKHNLLYKYQFGFRSNHSTTHALLDVTEYTYNALDEENYVIGAYIDLKKAFDSVSHEILLQKLQYYGIRGTVLSWFTYINVSNMSQLIALTLISPKFANLVFHKDQY